MLRVNIRTTTGHILITVHNIAGALLEMSVFFCVSAILLCTYVPTIPLFTPPYAARPEISRALDEIVTRARARMALACKARNICNAIVASRRVAHRPRQHRHHRWSLS